MRVLVFLFAIVVALALYKADKIPYLSSKSSQEQTVTSSEQSTPSEQEQPSQQIQQPTPSIDVKQAKEQAIRMYPALAQEGSTFNRAFVSLYTQTKERNSQLLASSDWPLRLANQVASSLGVAPVVRAVPTAAPVAMPVTTPSANTVPATTQWHPSGTALDVRPKKKP